MVEDQADRNGLFPDPFLHIELVVTGIDVPVETAEVVSGCVGSKISPFEATSCRSTRSFTGAVSTIGATGLETHHLQLSSKRGWNRGGGITSLRGKNSHL